MASKGCREDLLRQNRVQVEMFRLFCFCTQRLPSVRRRMLSHQTVALHTPVAPGSIWGTQETNSQPRVRVTPTNATPKSTPLSQHQGERGPMSPARDLIRIHQGDRRTPQGIRDTNPPHDPPLSACTKARVQKHYRADRTVPTREAPGRAPGSSHHPSNTRSNPTPVGHTGTPKKNPGPN